MFVANTLNGLVHSVCNTILHQGTITESRNGKTHELLDQDLYLENPKNRHLYLDGRNSNLYACLAEVFWVMAGRKELNPLMNFFLPRAKNYSDDNGETWTNAYGSKLYRYGNLDNVIQSFLKDGPNTRRAVMGIWTPETDTIQSLENQGITKPLDISCNNIIWIWIRDNKLFMKVGVRSNDVIFGLSAINVTEWTFLQECILRILQAADPKVYGKVELGYYHHSVISLHVYEETIKQAENILLNNFSNQDRSKERQNYDILLGDIKSADQMKSFFLDLYTHFCEHIKKEEPSYFLPKIFDKHNVPIINNQLYSYALLIQSYIFEKQNRGQPVDYLNNLWFSEDLREAVKWNFFTPKSWSTQF